MKMLPSEYTCTKEGFGVILLHFGWFDRLRCVHFKFDGYDKWWDVPTDNVYKLIEANTHGEAREAIQVAKGRRL